MENSVKVSLLSTITVAPGLSSIDTWNDLFEEIQCTQTGENESRKFLLASCVDRRCLVWKSLFDSEKRSYSEWILCAKLCSRKTIRKKKNENNRKRFAKEVAPSDSLLSCKFSPDGNYVVTCGNDHKVIVWDIKTESIHSKLQGHTDFVSQCVFSPVNEGILFTCSGDGRVLTWNWKTGVCMESVCQNLKHSAAITTMQVIPSSIYEVQDKIKQGKPKKATNKHLEHALRLLTASSDGRICFWDLPAVKANEEDMFQCNAKLVACVDGKYHPADAGGEQNNGQVIKSHNAHIKEVTAVSCNETGTFMATASTDETSKIWNTLSLFDHYESKINQNKNLKRAFGELEQLAASYIPSKEVSHAYDVPDGGAYKIPECKEAFLSTLSEYQEAHAEENKVLNINVDEENLSNTFSSNIYDSTIENSSHDLPLLLSLDSEVTHTLMHSGSCLSCSFSEKSKVQEDNLLFTTSKDCFTRIWCSKSGKLLYKMQTPEEMKKIQVFNISHMAPNSDSVHLLFGICGNKVLTFKLVALSEMQTLVEYVANIGKTNLDAFWKYHPNLDLFKRTMEKARISLKLQAKEGKLDLSSEREKLAKLILNTDEATSNPALVSNNGISHAGRANDFLLSLLSKAAPSNAYGLQNLLFDNMKLTGISSLDLCLLMVKTPFNHMQVLETVAMSSNSLAARGLNMEEFLGIIKQGKASIAPFLVKLGYERVSSVNEHGGDPQLGMIKLPDSEQGLETNNAQDSDDIFFFCRASGEMEISGNLNLSLNELCAQKAITDKAMIASKESIRPIGSMYSKLNNGMDRIAMSQQDLLVDDLFLVKSKTTDNGEQYDDIMRPETKKIVSAKNCLTLFPALCSNEDDTFIIRSFDETIKAGEPQDEAIDSESTNAYTSTLSNISDKASILEKTKMIDLSSFSHAAAERTFIQAPLKRGVFSSSMKKSQPAECERQSDFSSLMISKTDYNAADDVRTFTQTQLRKAIFPSSMKKSNENASEFQSNYSSLMISQTEVSARIPRKDKGTKSPTIHTRTFRPKCPPKFYRKPENNHRMLSIKGKNLA